MLAVNKKFCKFCGSPTIHTKNYVFRGETTHYVVCKTCTANGPKTTLGPEEAMLRWEQVSDGIDRLARLGESIDIIRSNPGNVLVVFQDVDGSDRVTIEVTGDMNEWATTKYSGSDILAVFKQAAGE